MPTVHTVGMLSVAKIRNADSSYYTFPTESSRGASPYYERDGTWEGNLRHLLAEDKETVSKADLDAIWRGEPADVEGFRLKGRSRIKNVAFDFTFSAPKSVSLLYALTRDSVPNAIEKCHIKAVKRSFEYLEERAACVRAAVDGSQEVLPCKGLLAAHFLHRVSRSNDPHLHSHLTVANLSLGVNDKWSALYTREVYNHIHNACLIYHWDLRFELAENLGLEFQNRTPYADLLGFGKMAIDAFSKRSRQIEEGLSETGYTSYKAKQISVYKTRPDKILSASYSDLQDRWKREAYEIGMSPNKLYNLLHTRKLFRIPEQQSFFSPGGIIKTDNVSVKSRETSASVSGDTGKTDSGFPQNPYSPKDHIRDNIILLSSLKVSFTRKEILGVCLRHINEHLSAKKLCETLDEVLNSEETIRLNSQVNKAALSPISALSSDNSDKRSRKAPSARQESFPEKSRNIKQNKTRNYKDTPSTDELLHKNLSGNRPQSDSHHGSDTKKSSFLYMNSQNYELFGKIDTSPRLKIKSAYFERLKNYMDASEISSANKGRERAEGSQESLGITGHKLNRDTNYGDYAVGTPHPNPLILTNRKKRATLLQTITGEEVLSFQEIMEKAVSANKNCAAFLNWFAPNGSLPPVKNLSQNRISSEEIKELKNDLVKYLTEAVKNKKVIYELSDNCYPILLHLLFHKVNSFAEIELIDSLPLSKVIRAKSGISTFFAQSFQ